MVFGYLFLAQMTTNPPNNSKSMFQHSFWLLHSWSHLRQTNRHTYQWGEHIRTQNMGKMLHFMVFGYLFLALADTNPPTNLKSMFQHSFPLLHSWFRLRQTNQYTYQWGEHIRTPNIGKLLHFMVLGYLFLDQTDTNPPTKPNLNMYEPLFMNNRVDHACSGWEKH